jgi:hypothetical protein
MRGVADGAGAKEQKVSGSGTVGPQHLLLWRTRDYRGHDPAQPVIVKESAYFDEILEIHRLDEKRVSAERVSLVDVANILGGSKDDDAQSFQAGLLTNPAQDLETVCAGHFEVQKQQGRQRVFVPVGECPFAIEVSDHLLTAANDLDWIRNARLFKGMSYEENVVFSIFGD